MTKHPQQLWSGEKLDLSLIPKSAQLGGLLELFNEILAGNCWSMMVYVMLVYVGLLTSLIPTVKLMIS